MEVFLNRYGLIAIRLDNTLTLDEISQKLGFDIDMGDKLSLVDALQADENRIGFYNDNLLLCLDSIFPLFEKKSNEDITKLLMIFNKETIGAVYYYSVPDLFGFAYFINGNRIRTKYGEHNKIWVDFGEKLTVEKETQSEDDINNWIVEQVTGEKLTNLAGKEIIMIKIK